MGNATGVLTAGRVLTFLGIFLGPLFPIIGLFMIEGVRSLAWAFIVIIILWLALPLGIGAKELREGQEGGDVQRNISGSMIAFIVLFLIYLGLLIYACYHVMADFRVVSDHIVPSLHAPVVPPAANVPPPTLPPAPAPAAPALSPPAS